MACEQLRERSEGMRVKPVAAVVAAVLALAINAVASSPAAHAGLGDDVPPPTVPGTRRVNTRDGDGNLSTWFEIPGSSLFAGHGGGGEPCSYRYAIDDDNDGLSDRFGTARSMNWVFEQTDSWGDADVQAFSDAVNLSFDAGWEPVADGFRRFRVGCVGNYWGVPNQGWYTDWLSYPDVDVLVTDSFFWQRPLLDSLRAGLSLERPSLMEPPPVGRWGGVPVRNPVWLSIAAGAWRTQTSPTRVSHGVELAIVAVPQRLEFEVVYVPHSDGVGVGPGESWTVPCVTGFEHVSSGQFPPTPFDVDDWSDELGVVGDCLWVPPGRGEVTITARITFDVFDWVSGFTAAQAPYVWESAPVTYRLGELRAVNVIGSAP